MRIALLIALGVIIFVLIIYCIVQAKRGKQPQRVETTKAFELSKYLSEVLIDPTFERDSEFDKMLKKYMTSHALELLIVWNTKDRQLIEDGILDETELD